MKYIFVLFFAVPAVSQTYFNIELRANWTDTTIIAGSGDVRFSDLWGFKYDNEKYAVVGTNEGSQFLKIEDNVISEVGFVEGAFNSVLVQHRDYKKYKNYIYAVCDEGNSTLQIIDISYLPDSVVKVYDSNEHFTICHNIFIDTLTAKLYACGYDNLSMKILDISDPLDPVLWMNFTNLDYVHDCYVSNDTAFLNAGPQGLRVYDFSSNQLAMEIGVLSTYQEKGYNHSGWMNKDKTVYCFTDETLGKKLKYCKLNKGIGELKVDALFGTRNASDFIAHNVYLHNGYAFVSYYNEGLRIFDLEQAPIREVAFYDTYNATSSFKLHGAWGIFVYEDDELVVVSDRQSGIFSFFFPFNSFRKTKEGYGLIGLPFIDQTSKLILNTENLVDLSFDIYSIDGKTLFRKELVKNWVNIPLSLSSGQFLFRLYSSDNVLVRTGKFIIVQN